MNDTLENKKTMYEAVMNLLDGNTDKTGAVPAFAAPISDLRILLGNIESKAVSYAEATRGKASAKRAAEDALVAGVMRVAAAVRSYAFRRKDVEMQAKAKATESDLRKLRDTELVTKASGILSIAKEIVHDLADFMITPEVIEDVQRKNDAFRQAIGSRESSVGERTGTRQSLESLFDQADDLLNEDLDKLMELVRETQQEFYNQYFAARVIRDIGVRHEKPAAPPPATPTP